MKGEEAWSSREGAGKAQQLQNYSLACEAQRGQQIPNWLRELAPVLRLILRVLD